MDDFTLGETSALKRLTTQYPKVVTVTYILIGICVSLKLEADPGFPTGCLQDQKVFEATCGALSQIKNTDTLVFATGETMPGCAFATKARTEQAKKTRQAESSLYALILRKNPKWNPSRIRLFLEKSINDLDPTLVEMLSPEEQAQALQYHREIKASGYYSVFQKLPVPDDPQILLDEVKDLKVQIFQENVDDIRVLKAMIRKVKPLKIQKPLSGTSLKFCAPDFGAVNEVLKPYVQIDKAVAYLPKAAQVMIYGHEVAHSYDLCRMEEGRFKPSNGQYPFMKLYSCLGDKVGKFRSVERPKSLCEDGVMDEAVCDGMANATLTKWIEAHPEYFQYKATPKHSKNGYVHLPRGYEIIIGELFNACREIEPNHKPDETHPSARKVLQEMLLRNPMIASKLGCSTGQDHCSIGGFQKGNTAVEKGQVITLPLNQR